MTVKEHEMLPQQDLTSFDTHRYDGFKKTSLEVLNVKKQHKTQTQKQFQQFNNRKSHGQLLSKQSNNSLQQHHHPQQHQQHQQYQYQQQQQQHHHQQLPLQNSYQGLAPPISSFRKTGSFNSFQSYNSYSDANLPSNPGLLPQGQWSGSSPEFSTNVSPTSGSLTYNEDNYRSYTSPTSNNGFFVEELSHANEKIRELQTQIETLQSGDADNKHIKDIEDMNVVLLEENQLLRLQLKQTQSELSSALTSPVSPIAQSSFTLAESISSAETIKELESKSQELDELSKKHESFKLNYEALSQEMNKLKLIHKSTQDTKNREIKRLKEEYSDLEKEFDSLYETSVSTGLTSPDNSSIVDNAEDIKINSKPPPQALRSVPSSPILPQDNKSYQDEIIQQLLITVRSLRSDNKLLSHENTTLTSCISRQKKMVRRLAEQKNEKVKIRKGLTILESIDVLI